jgi:hypothetical protein
MYRWFVEILKFNSFGVKRSAFDGFSEVLQSFAIYGNRPPMTGKIGHKNFGEQDADSDSSFPEIFGQVYVFTYSLNINLV